MLILFRNSSNQLWVKSDIRAILHSSIHEGEFV